MPDKHPQGPKTCLTLGNFVEWCRNRYDYDTRCAFVVLLRDFFIAKGVWDAPVASASGLLLEAGAEADQAPRLRQAHAAWLSYYNEAGLARDPSPLVLADLRMARFARRDPADAVARVSEWTPKQAVQKAPAACPVEQPQSVHRAPIDDALRFDLTPHLSPEARRHLAKLLLSPAAYEDLKQLTAEAHALWTDQWLTCVAASAGAFATSAYFKASHWFRTQPVHPFEALRLQNTATKATTAVIHLLLSRELGCSRVLSLAEVLLPDSYHEQRLIEEARIEG